MGTAETQMVDEILFTVQLLEGNNLQQGGKLDKRGAFLNPYNVKYGHHYHNYITLTLINCSLAICALMDGI